MDKINLDDAVREAAKNKFGLHKAISIIFGVLARLFLESWVVQLIWNAVISEKIDCEDVGYWDAFLLLVFVRIIAGQIKISAGAGKNKQNG